MTAAGSAAGWRRPGWYLHSRDALFGYHVVITSPRKFWNVPVKGQALVTLEEFSGLGPTAAGLPCLCENFRPTASKS